MAEITVVMPDIETAVLEALKERITTAALDVAKDVHLLIKDKASFDEELDVNNQPIKRKVPKPKRNPTNLPNLPLVQTGNMFASDRWVSSTVDDGNTAGAVVTYTPPDYFEYVIVERPWLTREKINPDVAAEIERRFRDAIQKG